MLIHQRTSKLARRGAMLPLIAVLLPVLVILLGFSVDLAYMQNVRMEMRAATDAAARAGATALAHSGTVADARTAAKQMAKDNSVGNKQLRLRNADIEVGRSTPNAEGRWVFSAGTRPYNSVRVTGSRDAGSLSGPVPLFFSSFYGGGKFEPELTATASFLNVDVCLVLDRSTSMKLTIESTEAGMYTSDPRFCQPPASNTRWAALDQAVHVFTDTLRDTIGTEQVALVSYNTAETMNYCGMSRQGSSLDAPLGTNLDVIDVAIERLSTTVWNGNTGIEAGMRTGLAAVTDRTYARDTADKYMIVMTDGHENQGSCVVAARDCAAAGVIVHTITFSDHADQTRMQEVAQIGGGRHRHASNPAELDEAFRKLAAQIAQITE